LTTSKPVFDLKTDASVTIQNHLLTSSKPVFDLKTDASNFVMVTLSSRVWWLRHHQQNYLNFVGDFDSIFQKIIFEKNRVCTLQIRVYA